MVPDGFAWTVGRYPVETWECCRGKIVQVMEGTTKTPKTTTTITTTTTTTTTTTKTMTTATTTTKTSTTVPCKKWKGSSGIRVFTLAVSPSRIGDPTSNKRCTISDKRNCTTCACDYYVKYSEDGGKTWLGLSFGGQPGGTGCPGYGFTSATQKQAIDWLQDKYIDTGLCGCETQETTRKGVAQNTGYE